MSPADIDRVFGRSRLKMVTGAHVEVFREEALPGERRRYTKRFLATTEGDFRHWTEREWRILARLVGHGIAPVPDVVRFDRGCAGQPALVQTYDAGVTVDHWATLLPVARDGRVLRHVFEDCAHWWALAQHGLIALDAIHELHLVHLDLKPDNVCIPVAPADFDPQAPAQVLQPRFAQIALIDFAFSLVSGENLATALPIGHQAGYEYQSPRLLRALEAGRCGDLVPTRQLDWRCDIFSLAAMLRRYLPQPGGGAAGGWTSRRQADAQNLIDRLFDAHQGHATAQRPHRELIDRASVALCDAALAASLERGWRLTAELPVAAAESPTPVTRIVLPVHTTPVQGGAIEGATAFAPAFVQATVPAFMRATAPPGAVASGSAAPPTQRNAARRRVLWAAALVIAGAACAPLLAEAWLAFQGAGEGAADASVAAAALPTPAIAASPASAALAAAAAAATAASAAAARTASAATPSAISAVALTAGTGAATSADAAPDNEIAAAPEAAAPRSADAPAPQAGPARAAAPATLRAPPRADARLPAGPAARVAARPAAGPAARPDARPEASSRSASLRDTPAVRKAALAPKPPPVARVRPSVPNDGALLPIAPVVAAAPAAARAEVRAAESAPAAPRADVRVAEPAPAPSLPPRAPVLDTLPAAASLPDEPVARAQALIADHLPRVAQRAERLVLRVLHAAARMEDGLHDAELFDAARAMRLAAAEPLGDGTRAPAEARRASDAADRAFWNGRNAAQALELQLRAFGADPQDAEVAGDLAFYYLKQRPAQPEAARRLALYALAQHGAQSPAGRIDDWTTLAIASALVGRERDARNAWFVTLALAPRLDRQCRAAAAAYASHGERMRAPTEAMLERIRSWGRSDESPFCRWRPSWSAGMRAP